ncbi:MAG: hypothetical protein DBX59_05790 [Bacillota bacterium]|nr:MAG: hypothetical protein DBX59_05790 [Bacillota bacterium]
MSHFGNNLKTLMSESDTSIYTLQTYLQMKSNSSIYKWLRGQTGIRLDTAIKLADFFACSLDFLMLGKDENGKATFKPCPPFHFQLKKVMDEKGVTQYQLAKDSNIKSGHLYQWLHTDRVPQMNSVITLADYLHVTIDYLVGRE